MPTLLFPDRETLRRALTSGIVPAAVARETARGGCDAQGRIWIVPEVQIARETVVALARLGAQMLGPDAQAPAENLSCWAQALPLQATPFTVESLEQTVLFELPACRFVEVAGEIRRLGQRAISYRFLGDPTNDESGEDAIVLLRVSAPPYFTLSRTLDQAGVAAYMERSPRTWIAVGYDHPLAAHIEPPRGRVLLLSPSRGWRTIVDGAFVEEGHELRPVRELPGNGLSGPTASTRGQGWGGSSASRTASVPSLPMRLRLKRLRELETPELWVFRERAVEQLHALVRRLDERTVASLTVALTRIDGSECVLVRVRTGKGAPPILVERASGYAPVLKLPNLFVPVDARLEPPIRRDVLRDAIAGNSDRLVWLSSTAEGEIRGESIAQSAFRPLSECVEYRCEASALQHLAWIEPDGLLALEPFAVRPDAAAPTSVEETIEEAVDVREVRAGSRPAERGERAGWLGRTFGWLMGRGDEPPRSPAEELSGERPAIPVEEAVHAALRPNHERLQLAEPTRSTDVQARCAKLESRFLNTLTGLSKAERLELWPELAGCYDQLGNHAEAAICWLNALWERDDLTELWAWGWLRAEAKSARWTPQDIDVPLALALPPNPATARTLAAYAVWGVLKKDANLSPHLGALQNYLDQHESWLPIRGAWLVRRALARISGGDVLGLARTRDRLLGRLLQDGLSLDLDTPAFLRFASSGLSDRFQIVRRFLTDKRESIHSWITQMGGGIRTTSGLQSFGLDVETGRTRGYVDLMIAWGMARFAEYQMAGRLRKQAAQVLAGSDPVHAFLRAAFEHRIKQVEEGKPPREALPKELLAKLDSMDGDPRYRVEKLLEHSRILSPLERFSAYDATFSPYQGFSESERTAYSLAGVADAQQLSARIDQVLPALPVLPARSRLKVARRLLGSAPRAGEGAVARVLQGVLLLLDGDGLPLAEQTELLEAGLFAAGHFDQGDAVKRMAARLVRLFERPRQPADWDKLPEPMEQAVRSLRRLGMKGESDQILHRVAETVLQGQSLAAARLRLKGQAWGPALRALLGVASGWYYAGKDEPAHAIIEEARKDLYIAVVKDTEKTQLALTYARTLGNLPVKLALGRFEELFQRLKGLKLASTTDSHYNLQILRLVETVVRGIVHEDFTLGPAVRGWLDDDEYLVRQRLHGELKTVMAETGV